MAKSITDRIPKLCEAINRSYLVMQPHRENRTAVVKRLAGFNWGHSGWDKVQPMNLLSMYISIMCRTLISKNPRFTSSIDDQSKAHILSVLQDFGNFNIEKMRLCDTLARCVTDALINVGIVQVSLATPADAANAAWNLKAGDPFVDIVDFDDFVFDTNARNFSEVTYIGNRVRIPYDVAVGMYGKKKVKDPDPTSQDNLYGDEKASSVMRGTYANSAEEFEDHIDIWNIYLPRHKKVVVLRDSDICELASGSEDPLDEVDWIGPPRGPYHMLGLGPIIPGVALTKAPCQDLVPLHDAHCGVMRKIFRTVDRLKQLTLYRRGSEDDAKRILASSDGDLVGVDSPEVVQQIVTGGGALNELQAIAMMFKELFSELGGNLQVLGGMAPQAKTATQENILNQNASGGVADMQEKVIYFTEQVTDSLCWFWWHNPELQMKSAYSPPGAPEFKAMRVVRPEDRNIPWDELNVRIDPYSMQPQTPAQKLKLLTDFVQGLYGPLAQQAQTTGTVLDIEYLFKKYGEYTDSPDIMRMLSIQEPVTQNNSAPEAAGPMSTNREYTRHSIPQERGADSDMMARLLTGKSTGGDNRNGSMNGVHG